MKIAIIGAGNLGLAIAKGIINSNFTETLYITKRNIETIKEFETSHSIFLTTDNKTAIKNSEIIIFAVQPKILPIVLSECKGLLTDTHTIISVVAGFNISKLEEHIGSNQSIIQAMPNTAISVNQSMTCLCSNSKGKERIPIALNIFNQLGHAIEIPEEQMQAATIICSSGIAFWMRIIRAHTLGAIEMGLEPNEAIAMITQTCIGAARLLEIKKSNPEQEIDKVTTPGGCTIAGINEMDHQGASSAIIKGLLASYKKISQISNK
ncbi:MAG: pyrroline-5-carboxylate reductase [Apibacter sp.]|uniref:pyrroline-5-carboxylate reductase n=1 Tax=Apibacter sp. TaxID=2023709 RepID=UPI0025D25D58|nr:pyrroline-5-carboxylate reductase [Apibacter sp.]MCT6869083.1 pyrroline-5-carboxylate reductase [Apibacter sp.]